MDKKLEEFRAKIRSYGEYERCWDGYRARTIPECNRIRAEEFLDNLTILPDSICTIVDGGIMFEWSKGLGGTEVYVEIHETEICILACYALFDGVGLRVRDVLEKALGVERQ